MSDTPAMGTPARFGEIARTSNLGFPAQDESAN